MRMKKQYEYSKMIIKCWSCRRRISRTLKNFCYGCGHYICPTCGLSKSYERHSDGGSHGKRRTGKDTCCSKCKRFDKGYCELGYVDCVYSPGCKYCESCKVCRSFKPKKGGKK